MKLMAHHIVTRSTTLEVGTPPPSPQRKPFACKVFFHRFQELSTGRGMCISSPKFEYNGRKWCLHFYPGGHAEAPEGYVSVFLKMCSKGSCFDCKVAVRIAFETALGFKVSERQKPAANDGKSCRGWTDFMKRSDILDHGSLLDKNGTLAVVVFITMTKECLSVQPFVPKNIFNDLMQGLLFDERTADVCFEVSSVDMKTPIMIPAHRLVLTTCAPMLSALFDYSNTLEGDEMARVVITDIEAEVFRLLLSNVYGRIIAEEDMETHMKGIIYAADKYAIVNLKLDAEAAYVKCTTITMENATDNLLYADALNLALLKEAVMDFLAENHVEAVKKVSFTDVPGHLMKDLLVAVGTSKRGDKYNEKEEDFDVMRVSELRVKLDKMGLDVDGSREAMIEALRMGPWSRAEGSFVLNGMGEESVLCLIWMIILR
eukprot:scaffold2926_cov109-Skeletonema_dohrnii-CCMP3373.AAC.11